MDGRSSRATTSHSILGHGVVVVGRPAPASLRWMDGWMDGCLSLWSSSFSMQPSNHVHLSHNHSDSHILIIHPCPDSVYVFPSSRLPFIRLFLSVLLVLPHFSSIQTEIIPIVYAID
ncbi:hypothetical protein FRB91_008300 [Serendipita sp. 411]|nr:hypothetical protein FRC18_011220 [Serendipita sp. 400]KAG8851200.1 hypothetical protein FRB91_008300 [Serendipita sp. 411]